MQEWLDNPELCEPNISLDEASDGEGEEEFVAADDEAFNTAVKDWLEAITPHGFFSFSSFHVLIV